MPYNNDSNSEGLHQIVQVGTSLIAAQLTSTDSDLSSALSDLWVLGYCFGVFDGLAQLNKLDQYSDGLALIDFGFTELLSHKVANTVVPSAGSITAASELVKRALDSQTQQRFANGTRSGGSDIYRWHANSTSLPSSLRNQLQAKALAAELVRAADKSTRRVVKSGQAEPDKTIPDLTHEEMEADMNTFMPQLSAEGFRRYPLDPVQARIDDAAAQRLMEGPSALHLRLADWVREHEASVVARRNRDIDEKGQRTQEIRVNSLCRNRRGVREIIARSGLRGGFLSRFMARLGVEAKASHRLTDTELFELNALLEEIEKRDAGVLPAQEAAELEQLLKRRDVLALLGKMRALSLTRQDVAVRKILTHFRRLGLKVTTARQAAEIIAGAPMTEAAWQRVRDVWERNFTFE